MTIADLIPSISVDNLVAQRDGAADRIRKAHTLLAEANTLCTSFLGLAGEHLSWKMRLQESSSRHDFTDPKGAEHLIRTMDAAYWDTLLKHSGLLTFMDAGAREAWYAKIRESDVPELTTANIHATFESLYGARGDMFERGVVKAFKALSWDYKTNLPVRFGKRIVLERLIETMTRSGGKRWMSGISFRGADMLDDLVRVMSVLDGKPEPDHRNGTFSAAREAGFMMDGSDCNGLDLHGYVSLKGFKNGNGHVTFLRLDLVDELNRIIAKHHPNALPPARE